MDQSIFEKGLRVRTHAPCELSHVSLTALARSAQLGPDVHFVPQEGIFLSFISCTFLSRLGDISGNFFAH